MYYVGTFYKMRGRWIEERKGYISLSSALKEARRQARRATIARVRDEQGMVAVFDNYADIEIPECFHDALSEFADSKESTIRALPGDEK